MSRRAMRLGWLLVGALILGRSPVAAAAPPVKPAGNPKLSAARSLLLSGKYEEAAEAYAAATGEPVAAAIGLARAQAAQGNFEAAGKTLTEALEREPHSTVLSAEAARLALSRGDLAGAEKLAAAALAEDADQLLARWVVAELDCAAGRIEKARAGYKWFVDYYNANDIKDAEAIDVIGQAAAQYARWNRLSDQFTFLVNELYPDALRADTAWWPAHYRAGQLYLEKYNQADAAKEFKAALALNPSAAEVYAAMASLALQNYDLDAARQAAERALEINPQLLDAHLVRANILLGNFQAAEAIDLLQRAVQLNPASESAQGTLAAAYAVVDGLPADLSGTRVGRAIDQATARNVHCGVFFRALAAGLDQSRKFPAAARFYRQAIECMPELVEPHGELGLVAMRLGDEIEAKRILDEAFRIDPFNVRVNNTLKVLEILDTYAVVETEHFVIKFDRGRDEILAQYAARYLEDEVYPELCERFGFRPEGKSLFEIFSRARNTSGHGWFSARMVGLPFVHTVGACAGKMVALTSPNDMPKKFNWARVLKHEFVHVLNLQQTDFSVPHWYTEALAVGSEGYPNPPGWNALLVERVKKNDLFDLDTINLGFIRPQSGEDWQMAYCQADLYARYLSETYGAGALAKMLAAYRDNLTTAAALKREFSVEQADFERGYLEFVQRTAAGLATRPAAAAETLASLERLHRDRPDDANVAARLAHAYLNRREYPQARELAQSALGDKESQQLAAYVLSRLRLVVGENREALALLEKYLDRQRPDTNLLNLLAGLKFKSEQYDQAAELYGLGLERYPEEAAWLRSLAKVYLAQRNDAKLATVLARLAPLDTDDMVVRKKLAQLSLAEGDMVAATRWGREALYIDVMDVDVHRLLAEAHMGTKHFEQAVDELLVAVKLDAKQPDLHFALAQACVAAQRLDRARTALTAALELEPGNTQAAELLEKLK